MPHDIDIIACGVWHQCKLTRGAIGSLNNIVAWVNAARKAGTGTAAYVVPSRSILLPKWISWLQGQGIKIIEMPIP